MKPFLFFELAIGPRRTLLVLQLVTWVGHYVGAFFNSFFPLQHFFRASLHPKTTIRGAAPNSTQLWSTLLILLNPEFKALSAF